MGVALNLFGSLGIALLFQSGISLAVPIATDLALADVAIDRPLDTSGYGFTSHAGKQEVFEDFALSEGTEINRITWYGLFSEGTVANNQSTGTFDVSIFRSNSDAHYLEKTVVPEGIEVAGLPDKRAIFTATSTNIAGVGTGQGDALHDGDIKRWTMDIPSLSLAPDKYFISIQADMSEPGFFLWNHSKAGADGYAIHGTSPIGPSLVVSAEQYDTQAFSLEWVASQPQKVPDSGPGIAAVFAVLGLVILSERSLSHKRAVSVFRT